MANTYDHLVSPVIQFFDDDGNPLSGGKVFTWVNDGGTTHKTSYTTPAGVANTNPIVLNARGECTICGSGYYRIGVYPATEVADPPTGAAVWTRDDALLGTDVFLSLKDDLTIAALLTTLGFDLYVQGLICSVDADDFFDNMGVSAAVRSFLDDLTIPAMRATLQIGNSANFSAPNAGMPYRSSDTDLAFVPGRVPLVLAADEMYLEMPAGITKTVACAANTIYYAYVAQPGAGLTIAAGDITVNTTAPTIVPGQGNRFMDATGVLQFLGAWPSDAASDFCTGVRDVLGHAYLTESAGTVNTANGAWGDVVLPGCPLIAGTIVDAWCPGAATAGSIGFSLKGNADDVLRLAQIANTFKVGGGAGGFAASIYTYGDGKIAAIGDAAAEAVATLRYLEPR